MQEETVTAAMLFMNEAGELRCLPDHQGHRVIYSFGGYQTRADGERIALTRWEVTIDGTRYAGNAADPERLAREREG
jgi:hypothetical protein